MSKHIEDAEKFISEYWQPMLDGTYRERLIDGTCRERRLDSNDFTKQEIEKRIREIRKHCRMSKDELMEHLKMPECGC